MTAPDPSSTQAFPWERVGSIIVIVAIVVAGMWLAIRQFSGSNDPGDPSPIVNPSAEASPPGPPSTATPFTVGTPDAETNIEWPAGSLPAMLEMAPDRLADDSLPLNDVARYADIAGWMAACNIPAPRSLSDPALVAWEAQLDTLTIPSSLRERGLDPVWKHTYGFDLSQVEQVLIVGQAPDYTMILRGAFDASELQRAWVTSGYQAVELDGQTVWSLFPGDAIDLSAQASRYAMGTLNNVVLLEDGTLIASARLSRLGTVLEVVDGDSPSLADNDDIAALLIPGSGIELLASAVIAKGSLVQGTESTMPSTVVAPPSASPEVDAAATPEFELGMPEVNLLLFGFPLANATNLATPSPQTDASPAITMILAFGDLEDARRAELEVTAQLDGGISPVTRQPYSNRLANPVLSVVDRDNRALVIVDGVLADGSGDWLAMLSDRDFGFAFWLPDE